MRQPEVLAAVGAQFREGGEHVLGAMIESNIVAGRQELTGDKQSLTYGQSITDGCVDFATTERMLEAFARDASQRSVAINA
jgi:3-deoxy-7-phosphoheptulonate synthase